MTEEEAKEKWCPYARLCGDGSNRGINPRCLGEVQCIGSECMAWRWDYFCPKGEAVKEVICDTYPTEKVDGHTWVESMEKGVWGLFPNHGHCGLAGDV